MSNRKAPPSVRSIVNHFRNGPAPAWSNGYGFESIGDLRQDLENPPDFDRALEYLWRAGRLGVENSTAANFDKRRIRLIK